MCCLCPHDVVGSDTILSPSDSTHSSHHSYRLCAHRCRTYTHPHSNVNTPKNNASPKLETSLQEGAKTKTQTTSNEGTKGGTQTL